MSQEQDYFVNVVNSVPTQYADSAQLTSFSRLRTAESRLLGDYRYMYGSGTSIMMNDLLANGGTLTPEFDKCQVLASVTAASGSKAVRQTKKYHPYTSGTSTMSFMTFCMNPAKANLVQSVGCFDELNGIFFRMNGTTPEIVIRKGGVDNEVIPQSQWNQDTLTELDFSKVLILTMDYQWLGVGRVRVGFVHDGVVRYAHYFSHDNLTTEVYMYQPSLPFRWEIYNTAATSGSSTLKIICASVFVEGTFSPNSYTKSVSTGQSAVAVSNAQGTTGVAVLAVRLMNSLQGKQNRSHDMLKAMSLFATNDAHYKLVVLQDTSKFLSAPTWTAVPGYGWSEYATGINMASGWATDNNFVVLKDGFITGSGSGIGATPTVSLDDNTLNSIFQNYDSTGSQIFAVIVDRLGTNNTDIRASLDWLEVK
jgi:hypothetical protein